MNKAQEKGSRKQGRRAPVARGSTHCELVQAFWAFWPAFQRWADSQTGGEGLTPQRTRIVALLQERGPQIMSHLRDELGVTATNITALVDGLEKDGFVCRKPHPEDRRATIVEVTTRGSACERTQGCTAYTQRVGELFTVLSETEREDLLALMDKLRARLRSGGA